MNAIEKFGKKDCVSEDREQLFRRMIYNILMNNEDDHLKNHCCLVSKEGIRLSPLYDVVPSEAPVAHLRTAPNSDGNTLMTLSNALRSANGFGLRENTAKDILEEMVEGFARSWEAFFQDHGVSKRDMGRLRNVLGPWVKTRAEKEDHPWVKSKILARKLLAGKHAVEGVEGPENTSGHSEAHEMITPGPG